MSNWDTQAYLKFRKEIGSFLSDLEINYNLVVEPFDLNESRVSAMELILGEKRDKFISNLSVMVSKRRGVKPTEEQLKFYKNQTTIVEGRRGILDITVPMIARLRGCANWECGTLQARMYADSGISGSDYSIDSVGILLFGLKTEDVTRRCRMNRFISSSLLEPKLPLVTFVDMFKHNEEYMSRVNNLVSEPSVQKKSTAYQNDNSKELSSRATSEQLAAIAAKGDTNTFMPKRKGRPKGAKNKPKNIEPVETVAEPVEIVAEPIETVEPLAEAVEVIAELEVPVEAATEPMKVITGTVNKPRRKRRTKAEMEAARKEESGDKARREEEKRIAFRNKQESLAIEDRVRRQLREQREDSRRDRLEEKEAKRLEREGKRLDKKLNTLGVKIRD